MKKFVTVVMVVALAMMSAVCAQAELLYKTSRIDYKILATKSDGTIIWNDRYYATVSTSNGPMEIEITKEDYDSLWSQEHPAKSWVSNIASFATFWNPND